MPHYLKLRNNVVLAGDIALAERELAAFYEEVVAVADPKDVATMIGLSTERAGRYVRPGQPIGFMASRPKCSIEALVRSVNFIQESWMDDASDADVPWLVTVGAFRLAIPLMASAELLQGSFDDLVMRLTDDRGCHKAPSTGITSTQHVHGLHKYKAKFFPRLIRSFLVRYMHSVPKDRNDRIVLLDPFVGSGTSLVEASLLGIDSIGIDIDRLSCAISQAKVDCLRLDRLDELDDAIERVSYHWMQSDAGDYRFPSSIARKFQRWDKLDEQHKYERQINRWLNAIHNLVPESFQSLCKVALSNALNKKFTIRMMGTGVNRFALEIASTPLEKLVTSGLAILGSSSHAVSVLKKVFDIQLGTPSVLHGSATDLPIQDSSISLILTSPPYLPASSGREDYLVGKAISNTAIGLMTEAEIDQAEIASVGSMKATPVDLQGLPLAVADLYHWLQNDELREIKAKPVVSYYQNIREALVENYRVLMKGGVAIYVIGKQSIFYTSKTREVLRRVECDTIFSEIARDIGFIVDEQTDVELDKKNMNARPRSLDTYYESVFVLRK